jgi:hypothetical protein
MDAPVSAWDESIPPIGGDDYSCYCCCSRYALNTPIEATKGEFVLIQDIQPGDSILTTGLDLQWKPGIVKNRSGDINTSMVPGLYLVKYLMPGEENARELLVTPDHLFLMYTSKSLKKVQHLIPGNKLMTADGKAANVVFVAHGDYETSIQSINMKEKFDGKDLTGHLINANGIVSTDYAVQSHYETDNIDDKLVFKFSNDKEVHDVGTEEYIDKFESPELESFLSNPEEWPKGFNPKRKKLINIPATAHGFVTNSQAADIRKTSEFNDYSNGVPRDTINKLFRIFSSNNHNINFILDWNNEEVNAYSWVQGEQSYLVITGGLARIKELFMDGLSLIIADMLTRLTQKICVAEADYASFDILSSVFPSTLYSKLASNGIRQITARLFDKINKNHATGNPSDVCDLPSIDCRKDAFWNGISFFDMPKCGVPIAQFFHLKTAYASFDLKSINVVFDNSVNIPTAEALINYNIEPGIRVTSAKVSEREPGTVTLLVEGIKPASKYILSITNVTSIDNQPLAEGAYTIIATA